MGDSATHQPELTMWISGTDNLTGIKGRVFDPVCLLDHKYHLQAYPDCYFIVRHDQYTKDPECERVCLYRENVVNTYLRGDDKPFTNLLSNELRAGRSIETLYRDMEDKAAEMTRVIKKNNF